MQSLYCDLDFFEILHAILVWHCMFKVQQAGAA